MSQPTSTSAYGVYYLHINPSKRGRVFVFIKTFVSFDREDHKVRKGFGRGVEITLIKRIDCYVNKNRDE